MRLSESAPAKVNLSLHVVGRRPDGYHDLQSLVVFADACDEIEMEAAPRDRLAVSGPFAGVFKPGEVNLVTRALAAFRERWPEAVSGCFAIELRKNLPVAAGLGGGSADAAAVLRLLARASAIPIPLPHLRAVAASLGADVPACLVSRPLELRGLGEIISPLRSFPACYLVLVNPLQPMITGEVFRRLASHTNPAPPAFPQPITRPELALWLQETRNDLEPPAEAAIPHIGELRAAMAATPGCVFARMSGSGASVFGLFGSSAQAHQAAHDMRARWPGHWVAAAPIILPEGQ